MLAWQFVIFQEILTSIAKKSYICVIFQGGGPDPLSPLWIRPWTGENSVLYVQIKVIASESYHLGQRCEDKKFYLGEGKIRSLLYLSSC